MRDVKSWRSRVTLIGIALLVSGCSSKSTDCSAVGELPVISSLPSSLRQDPLPAWCAGNCLESLTRWREASAKRLAEAE